MPDHAHLKSQHQFVALTDMYLHAKNQLYNSNSFRYEAACTNRIPNFIPKGRG